MRSEEEVPRRRRVVLVFSTGRGSCLARARLERAFFGFLETISITNYWSDYGLYHDLHLSKHEGRHRHIWMLNVATISVFRAEVIQFKFLGVFG